MARKGPLTKQDIAPEAEGQDATEIDAEAEAEKQKGETADQQKIRDYHAGKFQTHDPVTGQKRDKPLS